MPRQRDLLIICTSYALSILALAAIRLLLRWEPDAQFVASMATFLGSAAIGSAVVGDGRLLRGRLRGGLAIVNGLVLFAAVSATLVARQQAPLDWPLVAIGLVLPPLLVSLWGIYRAHLGGSEPSANVR